MALYRERMTQPQTRAEQLHTEREGLLADPTKEIDSFTLRRWVRDFQVALTDAGGEDAALLHGMLGLAWRRLREWPRALDAFKSAVHASRAAPTRLINLAGCFLELRRPQEALALLGEVEAKPREDGYSRVVLHINLADAFHQLGDAERAGRAMDSAIAVAQLDQPVDLFHLATQSAVLGREDDAVEFLARYAAAARGIDRGECGAIELVRESPPSLFEGVAAMPALAAAIANVGARHDAPEPDDMRTPSELRVGGAAWDQLTALLERPVESL